MGIMPVSLILAITGLFGFAGMQSSALATEQAVRVELELAESTTISKVDYTLRDLIVAESSGKGCKVKQCSGVIGSAPRPGYVANLTRTQIAARLEALFPNSYKTIILKGASSVKVHSVGVSLSSSHLVDIARSYLEKMLDMQYVDYSVTNLDAPRDFIVPKGEMTIRPSLRTRKRLAKRTCVWVDIGVAGKHYQSIPIWFRVESIQTVWVVGKDRAENDHLESAALQQQRRDVAQLSSEPFVVNEPLENMRFTQNVVAGQVLTRSMLEPIPAVEKGKLVSVRASVGHVKLRTRAVALSDGDLAQRISVRNRDSGESYAAMVIGQGEVAIDAF